MTSRNQLEQAREVWLRAPIPTDPDAIVERVKEVVAVAGDLPEVLFHEIVFGLDVDDETCLRIRAARPKGAPEYGGGWI